MPPIPPQSTDTAHLIDKYHESIPNKPRPYIGPSSAGITCDRALWYSFRWVQSPKHDGRIIRLFRRGTLEEETAARDLAAIGCKLIYTGQHQITLPLAPHVIGHPDGFIDNLPAAPKTRHVWECKTHNKKSFDDLEKNGVEKSKPGHFIQMQLYMHGTHLTRSLYYAVCKDDDRIYTERVEYSKKEAEEALARLSHIIFSDYAPARISDNPAWYECKMCGWFGICHQGKLPQRNCRTCLHSSPGKIEGWDCALHGALDTTEQYSGCRGHVPHPDLVPWPLVGEKCTKTSGYFEGIGLVGMDGKDSSRILGQSV
jgi:hypothetical protein